MPRPTIVCVVIVSLLCQTGSASPIDNPTFSGLQDTFDNLEQSRDGGTNKLRELATLYEALINGEGDAAEENAAMPPLQARLISAMQNQDFTKEKRASYMSLCHFKICNMGRKRNPYWNAWSRV